MKILLTAVVLVALAAFPALAQDTPTSTPTETNTPTPTETPTPTLTSTPTQTPTHTPTHTHTPTLTPVATPFADAEVNYADGRKRWSVVTLANATPVAVIAAPGDGMRVVVTDVIASSTAAASVQIKIGEQPVMTRHVAAGGGFELTPFFYGAPNRQVYLTRTAGSAAVDVTIGHTVSNR